MSFVFEFLDIRCYKQYDAGDQALLNAEIAKSPRPKTVTLHGKYEIHDFDSIHHGFAVQMNLQTGFERAVRIRPPYQMPGFSQPALPAGRLRFRFWDNRWVEYDPDAQAELLAMVQCAPPPQRTLLCSRGNLYYIIGLDGVPDGQLQQVNAKTGFERPLELVSDAPGAASPSLCRLKRTHSGGYRSTPTPTPQNAYNPNFSASSSGGRSLPKIVTFGAQNGPRWEPYPENVQVVLHAAWTSPSRPNNVPLPHVGVNIVQFRDIEAGLCKEQPLSAGSSSGTILGGVGGPPARPVSLRFPTRVADGEVKLPSELIEPSVASAETFGKILSGDKLDDLRARNPGDAECSICMCDMEPDEEIFELDCGHLFHKACLDRWFAEKTTCPQCKKTFGVQIGKQPREGKMTWEIKPFFVVGREAFKTIEIVFSFPPGVDDDGKRFEGRRQRCYLPCNPEGQLLLELYKLAFRRRVMFGLGDSMTLNIYRPTFNVHVKTKSSGGTQKHGYPDDEYFWRCLDELQANGVKIEDLARYIEL